MNMATRCRKRSWCCCGDDRQHPLQHAKRSVVRMRELDGELKRVAPLRCMLQQGDWDFR